MDSVTRSTTNWSVAGNRGRIKRNLARLLLAKFRGIILVKGDVVVVLVLRDSVVGGFLEFLGRSKTKFNESLSFGYHQGNAVCWTSELGKPTFIFHLYRGFPWFFDT